MGFSQAQKKESKERILEIAARQIKERGIESLVIGELMEDAGLAKGTFYTHFKSRDDLILQATKRSRASGFAVLQSLIKNGKHPSLEKVVDAYLNLNHVANPGFGCAICSLAGEAKSQPKLVKEELADNFQGQVDFIAECLSGKNARAHAVGIMTSMVGAVSTARAIDDKNLARTILEETKKMILKSHKR